MPAVSRPRAVFGRGRFRGKRRDEERFRHAANDSDKLRIPGEWKQHRGGEKKEKVEWWEGGWGGQRVHELIHVCPKEPLQVRKQPQSEMQIKRRGFEP